MTSTIAPRGNVYALSRSDPQARLADYRLALKFYLSQLGGGVFDRLVYVDNSGYPLDDLQSMAQASPTSGCVEFVSYMAAPASEDLSRFFLEGCLLQQAFKRSQTLNGADPGDVIWKVTGRYIVNNIASLVRSRPAQFDIYANFRNHPQKFADFYLFAARAEVWAGMLDGDLGEFRNQDHGEAILRRKLDAGEYGPLRIVPRFRYTPDVSGVRGHDAASYDGLAYRTKYAVRALANRLLPGLWI